MSAGSTETTDVGLPPVGDALGPLPDQAELPQTGAPKPREIVLGADGPIGKDSVASLTKPPEAKPAAKKRGRPAGSTGNGKSKKVAAPEPEPTAATTSCRVRMRLTVKKGDKMYAIIVNTKAKSPTALRAAFEKWAAQVEKVWAKL